MVWILHATEFRERAFACGMEWWKRSLSVSGINGAWLWKVARPCWRGRKGLKEDDEQTNREGIGLLGVEGTCWNLWRMTLIRLWTLRKATRVKFAELRKATVSLGRRFYWCPSFLSSLTFKLFSVNLDLAPTPGILEGKTGAATTGKLCIPQEGIQLVILEPDLDVLFKIKHLCKTRCQR